MTSNVILQGDCIERMHDFPDGTANTCVTSPPYFGLRDYGVDGQIGLEDTPDAYVARLVDVFREVRRVLRDDGTLWLNLGDSYAGSGRGAWDISDEEKTARGVKETYRPNKNPVVGRHTDKTVERGAGIDRCFGLKPKDIIGIPWRVAFALQADGWYLRQDIIWAKPNPMPESVTDRCTKSHEYIFLLSKSERYYFDNEAIKEDAKWERWGNQTVEKEQQGTAKWIGDKTKEELQAMGKKNKRDVWTVATKPYSEAHFATFPPALIEPCILAGCPFGGIVLDPFMGSGTTASEAVRHGRKYIGTELNPAYIEMAKRRILETQPPLF